MHYNKTLLFSVSESGVERSAAVACLVGRGHPLVLVQSCGGRGGPIWQGGAL
jgi:hypothetical protein